MIGKYSLLPLQASIFTNFVGPNISWMGYGIFLMELVAGLLLLLGLLTRLGAVVSLLQSLNLLIGLSAAPNEWYWSYGFMVVQVLRPHRQGRDVRPLKTWA